MTFTDEQRKKVRRHGRIAMLMMVPAIALAFVVPLAANMVIDEIARQELDRRQVVVNWRAADFAIVDGELRFSVYGNKQRGECIYDKTQLQTLNVPTSKGYEERRVRFIDDTSPGSTRAAGEQFFDRWAVSAADIRPGVLSGVVKHFCDATGVPVPTLVGPFEFRGFTE